MYQIDISDPLVDLAGQSGILGPDEATEYLDGVDALDSAQRAARPGDLAPIVFCRRREGIGGVMLQPLATEARFTNDATTNALTMSLQLVLAAGQIGQLQVRDVRQGTCLVGTLQQTYNQRAGTWSPGNFVVPIAGRDQQWEDVPIFCGTAGNYRGLTTASFVNTYQDYDERWSRQINLFCRAGIPVVRLFDGVTGPSDNWADLVVYLLRQSRRLPDSLIDFAGLETVAKFLEANQLRCNVKITQQGSLRDWLDETAGKFLCRLSAPNGLVGIRPLLPATADGQISLAPVVPEAIFDVNRIQSFEREWIPRKDRSGKSVTVFWRQQGETDESLVRSVIVGYEKDVLQGTPSIEYDLTDVCASENHAVKFGAFQASRRHYITHTARLTTLPGSYTGRLVPGQVIGVLITFETSLGPGAEVNSLYEISRISKPSSGVLILDLIHYPVDTLMRSVVAVEVARARGTGYVVTIPRDNTSCNVNDPNDASAVANVGQDAAGIPSDDNFYSLIGDNADFDSSLYQYDESLNDWVDDSGNLIGEGWIGGSSSNSGQPGSGTTEDPLEEDEGAPDSNYDPIDNQTSEPPIDQSEGLGEGSTLRAPPPECQGGWIEWERKTPIGDDWDPVGTGQAYVVKNTDGGQLIRYIVQCPGQPPIPSEVLQVGTQTVPGATGLVWLHFRSTGALCNNGNPINTDVVRYNLKGVQAARSGDYYLATHSLDNDTCRTCTGYNDDWPPCPPGSFMMSKLISVSLRLDGNYVQSNMPRNLSLVGWNKADEIPLILWATENQI